MAQSALLKHGGMSKGKGHLTFDAEAVKADEDRMSPQFQNLEHIPGETEEQRHARFEALRKTHYKKEALAEARRLAEEELRQAELEEAALARQQQGGQ